MPLIIPDASVMLKWVLPSDRETMVEEAMALLRAFQDNRADLLLPSLWQYEAGNVLGLHYPDVARQRLEALLHLNVPEYIPTVASRALALELVACHRVSYYDATYHAVALLHQGTFLTADRRYHDKAQARGGVAWLAEWRPA